MIEPSMCALLMAILAKIIVSNSADYVSLSKEKSTMLVIIVMIVWSSRKKLVTAGCQEASFSDQVVKVSPSVQKQSYGF